MKKPHKNHAADSGHWNKTAPYRERIRGGRGRARASVTDLGTVNSLRNAYRNDIATIERVCKLLEWAELCAKRCVDSAHYPYADTVLDLYGADCLENIGRIKQVLSAITHERAPRSDAGAPARVLAKARAARITRRKKGGAL